MNRSLFAILLTIPLFGCMEALQILDEIAKSSGNTQQQNQPEELQIVYENKPYKKFYFHNKDLCRIENCGGQDFENRSCDKQDYVDPDDAYLMYAHEKNNKYYFLEKEALKLRISSKKCIVSEEQYKKIQQEQNEKLLKAEKNGTAFVKKNFGKPYCTKLFIYYDKNGEIADESREYPYMLSERKKNCVFLTEFKILQVRNDGFIVQRADAKTLLLREAPGLHFIEKNKNDADLIDGDTITGFFEYIGTHSFSLGSERKTVMKFKHHIRKKQ